MKDILIFFSDQHAGRLTGYAGDPIVRTPNLDRLAKNGVVLENAYTSCPLCVPARMSFMVSQLPHKTGIFSNNSTLHSDQPTFVHDLGAAGYETVLCGRMHFVGPDQRHGFTKRIAAEKTPCFLGRPPRNPEQKPDPFAMTTMEIGSITLIGAGNSPTLEYDRYVVKNALEYLDGAYEKPQFICVGTYAPHFPYVAPPELYDYYYDRVARPASADGCYDHPALASKWRDCSPEVVRAARAAYYGMIEFTDQCIGQVYAKFQEYLKRTGHEGLFVYLSDHGDQCGERGYYGKQTLFEASEHIPVVFCGDGIPAGLSIKNPTSLMDIGPTLCQYAGADMPFDMDGKPLYHQMLEGTQDEDRAVIAEHMEGVMFGPVRRPARMVVWKNYKLITYYGLEGDDMLFDLDVDPDELVNIAGQHPDLLEKLRAMAAQDWNPEQVLADFDKRTKMAAVISKWGTVQGVKSDEDWICPPEATVMPTRVVRTQNELPMPLRKRTPPPKNS